MSKEVKEPAVRMIKRDTISTAKAWGIRSYWVFCWP